MKKVIVVMLLVVGCNALLAQTPHAMDTIMGRPPIITSAGSTL